MADNGGFERKPRERRTHAEGGGAGRIPPQNLEAEQSTLGSMMIDRSALEKGIDILQPEDFYREAHQTVFQALRKLAAMASPVDILTVQEELRTHGRLDTIGGTEYLAALIDSVPTSANIEYYARIVEEKAILRRVIECSISVQAAAYAGKPPAEVIAGAQAGFEGLQDAEDPRLTVLRHGDLVEGELPDVSWTVLNLVPAGGISVIGGDSGVGKSWLALHLAQCVASGMAFLGTFPTQQGKVLVLDAESGPNLLARRVMKLFGGLRAENPDDDIPADLPLAVMPAAIRFKPDMAGRFADYLRREGIGLVIADPLIHFVGVEENSAAEMAGFFEIIREIIHLSDCTFIFTHHSRKESRLSSNAAGQMLRGSSAIRAILDSHLFIRKLKGGNLLVEHDKCRFAEPVESFVMEIVDLDEETTVCSYIGEAEQNCEKTALAADCAMRTLADGGGAMARKDIIEQSRGEGIPERTMNDALARLVASGELTKRKEGRTAVYELSALSGSLTEEAE